MAKKQSKPKTREPRPLRTWTVTQLDARGEPVERNYTAQNLDSFSGDLAFQIAVPSAGDPDMDDYVTTNAVAKGQWLFVALDDAEAVLEEARFVKRGKQR